MQVKAGLEVPAREYLAYAGYQHSAGEVLTSLAIFPIHANFMKTA